MGLPMVVTVESTSPAAYDDICNIKPGECVYLHRVLHLQIQTTAFITQQVESVRKGDSSWGLLSQKLYAEAVASGWAVGWLAQQSSDQYTTADIAAEYLHHLVSYGSRR